MKLPFSKSTRRFLLWGFGLAATHLGASFALRSAMEWLNDLLYRSSVPGFMLDERLHVLRELVLANTVLLHLPVALAEASGVSPPESIDVWWIFAFDALLYGFGIATFTCWLRRPPRFCSRFALPFVTRQTMAWAMLLAVAHAALSAVIYFGFRFATAGTRSPTWWPEASQMLTVLHPWLLGGGLRPYEVVDPTVIAVALLDALAWGFLAALIIAACLRMLRKR